MPPCQITLLQWIHMTQQGNICCGIHSISITIWLTVDRRCLFYYLRSSELCCYYVALQLQLQFATTITIVTVNTKVGLGTSSPVLSSSKI